MKQTFIESQKEKKLIEDFLTGDEYAAKLFFENYAGIIEYVINSISIRSNSFEKRDLFNETIYFLLKNNKEIIHKFKFKSSFSSYLYPVCRRFVLSIIKKEQNRKFIFSQLALPDTFCHELGVYDELHKVTLTKMLNNLPIKQKLLIKMVYYDDRSTEEVMHYFSWTSVNSVYGAVRRIIEKLRKEFKGVFSYEKKI